MNFIIISVIIFLFILFILFFARLFVYVLKLEQRVIQQEELAKNLMNSVKEIVQENYLKNDGRLKKFLIEPENKKKIIDGITFLGGNEDVEI